MAKSTVKYSQLKQFVSGERSNDPSSFNICRNKNFQNKMGVNLVSTTMRALSVCDGIIKAKEQPLRDELTSGIDSLRSKYVRTVFENPSYDAQGRPTINIQFEFNNYEQWHEYKNLEEKIYDDYGKKISELTDLDIELDVEFCEDAFPIQFFPLEKQTPYYGIVLKPKEVEKEQSVGDVKEEPETTEQ